MIPTDLASRLRLLIDSEVKALVPIDETPADLPDLQAGQRFTARIETALPDGTFRAQVAGRSVTLSMASSAKAGDTLELIVTGNNDKTISARLADTAQTQAGSAQPRLSSAGQLISQLLTGRHADTQGATLNRNEPLLPAPPMRGGNLPPILRQAISESGLFYEAHQAQWVEGETPLASLLREPQAQAQTQTPAAPQNGQATQPGTPTQPDQGATQQSHQTQGNGPQQNQLPGHADNAARASLLAGSEADARQAVNDTTSPSHSGALKIAEQLMPIVHQQLETLATHQAVWQGQIWPGQTMQWEIIDPEGEQSHSSGGRDNDDQAPWQSTLRLQMPRLGGIEAQLIVTPAGVAVRVSAESAQTAQQLREGGEALGSAMEAAGVPMTGFAVLLGGPREGA